MPATKPKPANGAASTQNDQAIQFVKCDLTEAQKRDLVAFSEALTTDALLKWLESTVMLGHVISVRANDNGFQCSLTGARGNEAHTNKCLVARASTVTRAMHSAMFKEKLVLKGDWSKVQMRDDLDF